MKRRGLFFQMATRQDGISFDDEGHATMEKKRLRSFWLFSLATDESLFRLCAMFVSRRLKEGERLFARGDTLDTVHFVASGRLALGEQFPKASGAHAAGGAGGSGGAGGAGGAGPAAGSRPGSRRPTAQHHAGGPATAGGGGAGKPPLPRGAGRRAQKATAEGIPARIDSNVDDGGVLNEEAILRDIPAERDCWAVGPTIVLSLPRKLFQQARTCSPGRPVPCCTLLPRSRLLRLASAAAATLAAERLPASCAEFPGARLPPSAGDDPPRGPPGLSPDHHLLPRLGPHGQAAQLLALRGVPRPDAAAHHRRRAVALRGRGAALNHH